MLNFIQEQSQAGILFLVTGVATSIALAVLWAAITMAKRFPKASLDTVKEAIVPMGTILGLLLGFLADRSWENFDRAERNLNQEIVLLGQIASASSLLPEGNRDKTLKAIAAHIRHVLESEWNQMSSAHAPTLISSPGLAAIKDTLASPPQSEGERLGQQSIATALSEVSVARANRLRASQTSIAPLVWWTILSFSILVMVGLAIATSGGVLACAISIALYTTSISLTLTMILAFDRPFSGGVTVSKEPMQELLAYLSR